MKAIKVIFDGEKVVLPDDISELQPGEVILVFGAGQDMDWIRAQESALERAWDNEEDAVYDSV